MQPQINLSGMISTLGVFAIITLMVVAVFVAVIYSRKRGKKSVETAQQIGFTALDSIEPEVLQQLRELYQPTRLDRVSYVAKKVDGDEQIYLLDAFTSSRDNRSRNSGNVEYRNVVMISPRLNLPAFLLIQRMPKLGPLGGVLDDMITTGASMEGFQLYDNVPGDFDLRYMLYVAPGADVARAFTDAAFAQLAQTKGIVARGLGHALVFNTYDVHRGVTVNADGLVDHVNLARQVCGWLSQ
jgi:hypothetical protein